MTHGRATLRDARPSDCESVFHWRNDPYLVALSGSGQTVDWDSHVSWFDRQIKEADRYFFIVERLDHTEIGVVRFHPTAPEELAVSIYLAPKFIGHGFGPCALAQSLSEVFSRNGKLQAVRASVLKENTPSCRMFERLGFERMSDPDEKPEIGYVLTREVWEARPAATTQDECR